MDEEIRRSSRANKGRHNGRAENDIYYLPKEGDEPASKKIKIAEENGELTADEPALDPEDEGKVRCDGCRTTEENYDEETDEGGIMIECERCKTWQHAKCMGYPTKKLIPKVYFCNRCKNTAMAEQSRKNTAMDDMWSLPAESGSQNEPRGTSEIMAANGKTSTQTQSQSAAKPKLLVGQQKLVQVAKTRANVTKALDNVMVKTQKDLAASNEWATKLEDALYTWAGATDKRYIEKSRSVMALVKKPAVLTRLILNDLSPADFTLLSVEDIDPDLKHYAEKVRQELIRRSVLTVSDDQSQRIRRTHKGEEIVETKTNENHEDASVGVGMGRMGRMDEKDRALILSDDAPVEGQKKAISTSVSSNSTTPTVASSLYQLGDDDDDDFQHTETNVNTEETANSESEGNSDEELDFILKTKKPQKKRGKTDGVSKVGERKPHAPALPPMMPTSFWAGEIVFPDVATFGLLAEFVSCTNYQKPKDNTTVSFHNKAMRVCRELLEKKKYQIEGRLDRTKADPYLSQITKLRDLYLIKLRKEDPSYSKVFEYLLARSKVGVLSGRAHMVKDAYLLALKHDAPNYLDFATVGEGLYILFSVKKDYVPASKSILKKVQPESVSTSAAVANLDNILLKLEDTMMTKKLGPPHLPQKPVPFASTAPAAAPSVVPAPHIHPERQIQAVPEQLSQDQMSYLSTIVQQNPHVQSDPQALLNLLQQMQT